MTLLSLIAILLILAVVSTSALILAWRCHARLKHIEYVKRLEAGLVRLQQNRFAQELTRRLQRNQIPYTVHIVESLELSEEPQCKDLV